MRETAQWSGSFSTVAEPGKTGSGISEFKKFKEAAGDQETGRGFPGISGKIKAFTAPRPSLSGIISETGMAHYMGYKRFRFSASRTQINTKTKIPNLHLTGQNISIAWDIRCNGKCFITCFSFVDKDKLVKKVKNA
jgi:all-trans-retinol 13,14-reductase